MALYSTKAIHQPLQGIDYKDLTYRRFKIGLITEEQCLYRTGGTEAEFLKTRSIPKSFGTS